MMAKTMVVSIFLNSVSMASTISLREKIAGITTAFHERVLEEQLRRRSDMGILNKGEIFLNLVFDNLRK